MTFEEWLKSTGRCHWVDTAKSFLREAFEAGKESGNREAREECAAMADAYEADEMDWLAKEIRETIK